MRLLISGGGTGGHVYPALTVAAAMSNQTGPLLDHAANTFLFVGRADSIEERLAAHAQIPFAAIKSGPVRGQAPWVVASNLWRVYHSIGKVRLIMRAFKPNVVFVTGGYVSAPVIWASAAEKIPSVVYLPDLEPGWSIRATSHWTTKVAVSFTDVEREFPRGKAVTTGYPVRRSFFNTNKAQARIKFHLDPAARTVAIFGGSSGAHHINQAAIANLVELTRVAQVLLLTGRNDEVWAHEQVERLSEELQSRVRVYGYLDEDLPHALATADVIIARGGAATLGEFPALGTPAILVPGPYAGVHQERNADFLVKRGAAIKISDAALGSMMIPTLQSMFAEPGRLDAMGNAMRALARPDAARNIAALLGSLGKAGA
jgi:UDP-N-acetylglucosamine--N-acetylmuramyl-(pentapeptide) pyrophosphoryl-undecaprenol N-acetylglucosamine transferase